MSPALLLLRLMVALLAPLLVAPSVVSLGTGAADRQSEAAALALAPAVAPDLLPVPGLPPVTPIGPPVATAEPVTVEAETATPAPTADEAAQAAAPAKDEGAEPKDQGDAPAKGKDAPKADAEAPARAKAEAKGEAEPKDKDKADAPAKGKDAPEGKGKDAPEGKAKSADAPAKGKGKADAPAKGKGAPKDEAKGADAAPRARAAAAAALPVPRSLYLAVGHGRAPGGTWQPGAEHPRTGALEVDAAQIMVDAMVEVLREVPGLELHFESGEHPNMIGSVANANALGVDDCIEVHQDTAAAPPGVFGHWYAGATAANRLANHLANAVADHGVPIRHDWHRARSGLYWVRKSECRAVLMEVGRVGDFGPKQLRAFGRSMAEAYLAETAEARGAS